MLIGAHAREDDPIVAAAERGAEIVQFFLGDPQDWKKPKPMPRAADLLASDLTVVVHAPYPINLASTNNRIRIPSRKLLMAHAKAAAELGAKGLIVHGGHVGEGADLQAGFDNWRKAFQYAESDGGLPLPVLIENTAGGDNAIARRFDNLARLWDAVGDFGAGFCLDTCHAHAGGEDLLNIVDRVKAITGRIDLVHANDSKDRAGSGRDRHENLGHGQIDLDTLVGIVQAAGAPVVCETPGPTAAHRADVELLRSRLGGR